MGRGHVWLALVGALGENVGVLFAEVVAASTALGGTRSRKVKISILAKLLTSAAADEVGAIASFLTGRPTQGRIGTGWRTLVGLDVPPATAPTLGVTELDETLGELAVIAGAGSAERRSDLLRALFARTTEDEHQFLFRLLTGELRQGALEGIMLDAIAEAASVSGEDVRRAFMLSGQISVTASTALAGGRDALRGLQLQLGRPIRPMLASPAESLTEALAEHPSALVEYKMDGARIQVHRSGDEVHVYTRTLREITDHVTELVELVRGLPCHSVILDGETLALTDDGRPRPFQETMSRFGSSQAEQVRRLLLQPYFFDCLHVDGVDLLDAPLVERNKALREVVGEHIIPGSIGTDNAAEVLATALAQGHEGIMVKALDSPYVAGRRGRAWLKVKPVHTVDLVVLAAEWGHGRRTGYLSNLHLGARDPEDGSLIMVGKTFKGMTDEMLAWQTEKLQEIEQRRTQGTVYVHPELVVEIELDGVQTSTRYPGGLALRFARVVRYRPDKDPIEADTIETLRNLP